MDRDGHNAFAAVSPSKFVREKDVALQRSILKKQNPAGIRRLPFLYQLALAVQLQCADFLPQCKIVISGAKRAPLYTVWWHHIVADGADVDDAHRSLGRVLCSHREKWKEQFGEIKMPCKVNPV
jgi:hypothetical protein